MKKKKKIVFTDVDDERLYAALKSILSRNICLPILVGEEKTILNMLKKHGLSGKEIVFFQPSKYKGISGFANDYFNIRKKKGMKIEEAVKKIKEPVFFGAMLVKKGLADGMVSGLSSKTKPFIPAFHIIGLEKGAERVSGLFIMRLSNAANNNKINNNKTNNNKTNNKAKTLYFADCAVNINPDEHQLAEIAILSGKTVRMLGDKPRIALLSFSTHGSAKHELAAKVQKAAKIAKQLSRKRKLGLLIDGELQFDAAFIPEIQRRKCSWNILKGPANVFIFPDLNSGNICYKMVERLAGAKATGPILQGLKLPVNDLSRGCSGSDIAAAAKITCLQAGLKARDRNRGLKKKIKKNNKRK
ncbi:MAG: phosphotransacetylase [Candidatus Woesearchaeota archaeon]